MESLRELAARFCGLAWRRRWWAILAAWVVCVAGWSAVATMPDQFEANARVYIDADALLTPLLKGIAVESSLQDELDLLQHMLLSRPNLERIIDKGVVISGDVYETTAHSLLLFALKAATT